MHARLVMALLLACLAFGTLHTAERIKLTLTSAVLMGLDRNTDLVKKRMEISFKKMTANETWRSFLPQIGFTVNRAVTTRIHEADSRQYRYEVSVDQLVFDSGKTKNAYNLSMADATLAKKTLEMQERSLRLDILSAYAKVLGGRDSVKLYTEFLQASEKELELADIEVKLGTTTIVDRDEIATEYESAKLDLLKSREDWQDANIAFGKLLKLPVGSEFDLLGEVDAGFGIRPLYLSEMALFAIAQQERVDFINSALAFQKAVFEYETIRDSWLPDISLSGKFFLSGPDWTPTEKGYDIYLKFSFPFFGSPASTSTSLSGGNDTTTSSSYSFSPFQDPTFLRKRLEARTSAHFAKIDREELPEDVRREIRLAVVSLEMAAKKFTIRERQIEILRKRIYILDLKTKLGDARRLDLAKARIELYKSEIGRIEQIIEYVTSSFKLETTIGLLPGSIKLFTSEVFKL